MMTKREGSVVRVKDGQERVLLRVVEAGELCGFSRSVSYAKAASEWKPFAIRLSERVIRIPYDSLMEWVEQKKAESGDGA